MFKLLSIFILGIWFALPTFAGPKVLVELFTSQSCYSCPDAEKLLAEEYVNNPEVLALELHVDYWNDLVYWGSSWVDPYSSPAYTQRQINYTRTIKRRPFTPQAIIQGAYSATGTNQRKIDFAISEVTKLDLAKDFEVRFEPNDNGWQATILTNSTDVEIIAVTYLKHAVTEIKGGENKDETLENHNIVTSWTNHGLAKNNLVVDLIKDSDAYDCALIVQQPKQGVVLGAWSCPTTTKTV